MTNATRSRASGRSAAPAAAAGPTRRRVGHIGLWVLQAALALVFFGAAMSKLTGDAEAVEMFDELGTGQWLRYVVGGLELAGAVGLLLPWLRSLAALGLATLMLCAVVITIFVFGEQPAAPLAFMVIAAVIATARRGEARALTQRFSPGR